MDVSVELPEGLESWEDDLDPEESNEDDEAPANGNGQ